MKRYFWWLILALLAVASFAWIPFLCELTVGMLLFSGHFLRKEDFEKRAALSAAAAYVLSLGIFIACYYSGIWWISNTLCYLLLFGIALIIPFACFDEQPGTLLLGAISGYMVQHIASQFSQMIWQGDTAALVATDGVQMFLFGLSRFVIYGLIYLGCYYLFARHTVRPRLSAAMNQALLGLAVITLLVVSVLSSVRDTFAAESWVLMIVSRLFSVFCCVFLLYLRSGIIERSQMAWEREEMQRLYTLQQEQYEQSKENIELINIKCHDLKRRVAQWERQGGRVPTEEIREVRDMIGIYDSAIKTGNEALDVLLSERSLYCEQHGIRLTCMVDGSQLSFMSVGDICALFGNALENAIEAVSKLENQDERIISFQARQSRGMLVVRVDNYFTGQLTFDKDLPKTTKDDSGYHGFGMKSIRLVTEKYGGELTVTADDMFHLTVLLPIPTEE